MSTLLAGPQSLTPQVLSEGSWNRRGVDGVDAEDCSMRSGLALRSLGISFQLNLCCNFRNPCMKEYSTS